MKRFISWLRSTEKLDSPTVDRHFEALRTENYSDSFTEVEAWLERCAVEQASRSQPLNPIWNLTMKSVRPYRLRLALSTVVLALFITACNMPVEQEETLGYVLSGTLQSEEALTDLKALPWVKEQQLTVKEHLVTQEDGTTNKVMHFAVVMPEASSTNVAAWERDLSRLPDVQTVNVAPYEGFVERPAYAATLKNLGAQRLLGSFHSLRKLSEMNVEVEEVEEVVIQRLRELNMGEVDVEYVIGENGQHNVALLPLDGTALTEIEVQAVESVPLQLPLDASAEHEISVEEQKATQGYLEHRLQERAANRPKQ